MEKKTVFLEIPCDLLDKIDSINTSGDRSRFVAELLDKQLTEDVKDNAITTNLCETSEEIKTTGEVNLVTSSGASLGSFDINSVDGFVELAKKIKEVSEDPMVRIRASRWL